MRPPADPSKIRETDNVRVSVFAVFVSLVRASGISPRFDARASTR